MAANQDSEIGSGYVKDDLAIIPSLCIDGSITGIKAGKNIPED